MFLGVDSDGNNVCCAERTEEDVKYLEPLCVKNFIAV